MPITSPKKVDDFKQLFANPAPNTKACLFVFLTSRTVLKSGDKIRAILNQYDADSAKDSRSTQIFYPVVSEDSDDNPVIKKLWRDYNTERWVPFFLFTDVQGGDTGVSFAGLPTSNDLIEKVRLVVPNP